MLKRVLAVTWSVCLAPAVADAQPARSVAALLSRVATGDAVYVTDRDGREVKGPILDLSESTLVLGVLGQRMEIPFDRVARVERDGDPPWNGAAIGALVALPFALVSINDCAGCGPYAVSTFVFYAGIGALFDFAHIGRTRIYAAPPTRTASLAPILSGQRKGIALAVTWH
jgi:hypothetical protein